jgi:hypothetical protein
MSNPYEELARQKKAKRIADTLQGVGIVADDVARFSEEQWGLACGAAEVNRTSDATRSLVVEMLREREGKRQ